MDDEATDLAPISVEALILRADPGGRWSYRRVVTLPQPGESPDQAARRVSSVADNAPSSVVHSTSWRYRPEGRVVLTYAVCPDPAPQTPAIELPSIEIARCSVPARPSPDHLDVAHVAAHGIHHLAFLMNTDPVVGAALRQSPDIATALESLWPAAAGEIFRGRSEARLQEDP